MRELNELAVTYEQALSDFDQVVRDAQRQWAARQLASYPDRNILERTAQALAVDLQTDLVQVNALNERTQDTLVEAPDGHNVGEIPIEASLCVLSIGMEGPAQASDVQNDPFLEGHPTQARGLTSWASAPIMIEGVCAGTICALEVKDARHWGAEDQALLEQAAGTISSSVTAWAQDKKYRL